MNSKFFMYAIMLVMGFWYGVVFKTQQSIKIKTQYAECRKEFMIFKSEVVRYSGEIDKQFESLIPDVVFKEYKKRQIYNRQHNKNKGK